MLSLLLLVTLAVASPSPAPQADDRTKGSGAYPAAYSEDPGLTGYTFYSPINPPEQKMPVILWGNGMCSDSGLGFQNFLREIASHGYIVIANGKPGNGMMTQASDQKMKTSLEYVTKVAGTGSGPLRNADKTRIGAAGQSCGGWQAYKVSGDKRIGVTGIFDSGGNSNQYLKTLHAPVGYFLGGSSDMAFSGVR
jgi:predicted dienelactone hydrolase